MTQRQRLKEMSQYLKTHYELTVNEACTLFNASPATIRRDFNALIEGKQAEKSWGGITALVSIDGNSMEPVAYRETLFADEKRAIAARAASLVSDGDVIMIDGGSTTYFMTKFLAEKKIRVITNSILIAYQLDKEQKTKVGAEVFLTGGLMYPEAGLVIGPQAIENIRQYHAKFAFLSIGGIEENQVTNSNQLVVETERAIIGQSEKVILLADKSKLGKRSMCRVCSVNEVDVLITNQKSGKTDLINKLVGEGLEVVEV